MKIFVEELVEREHYNEDGILVPEERRDICKFELDRLPEVTSFLYIHHRADTAYFVIDTDIHVYYDKSSPELSSAAVETIEAVVTVVEHEEEE